MRSFRYDTSGTWYKGNTHIHSTASDGGKAHHELDAMYSGAGYDFLYHTDHWAASDAATETHEGDLLWMDGIELDGHDHGGSYYHVVCLGKVTGITREMGFVPALESARAQGAFLILAHPHWTGNSLEEALRGGFDGVEVYNHVCRWLNGKSGGEVHWSAMLERFPDTLAFSVDDAHIRPEHPGWNGGWIMVNAPELTRDAIDKAIRAGNFYSSCGPEFHAITHEDGAVSIQTSPVQFVRLVGPSSQGRQLGSFDGATLTEATQEIPSDWPYAYLEIEDTQGRRAWTNPLFVGGKE
jgi:hypothetical protein